MSASSMIAGAQTTATVKRSMPVNSMSGISVPVWVNHLFGVRVFVQHKTGSESVRYGRESTRRITIIYIELGHDIKTDDRLIVGSKTFDIQYILPREYSPMLEYMATECEETKGTP